MEGGRPLTLGRAELVVCCCCPNESGGVEVSRSVSACRQKTSSHLQRLTSDL